MALESALLFAKELDLREVLIEGEAQSVVNVIKGAVESSSSVRPIIEGIKLLLNDFVQADVGFTGR